MNFHERRLPHYGPVGHPVFLTWRLFGTLPRGRRFPQLQSGRAFVAMDRLLDNARTGPLYPGRPEIATMVVDAIRYRDGSSYDLHNYVVMANHVHMLITPHQPLSRLRQSLKRFTARKGNRILGLTGQTFWQDESFDRSVRSREEFARIAAYIEKIP